MKTQEEESAALGAADAASLPTAAVDSSSGGRAEEVSTSTPTAPKDTSSPPAAKARKLTDAEMVVVKADLAAMAGYLMFGSAGVGKTSAEWSNLPCSAGCWAPASRDYSRPDANANIPQIASYAWYRLMCARQLVGQPLDLPVFTTLIGVVKNLRNRMTQPELVGYVDAIAKHWPAIVAALSWMESPPALNESTLNHPKILELTAKLARGENIAAPPRATTAVVMSPASLDLAVQIAKRKNVVSL